MGPRRNSVSHGDTAQRQVAESNSTLNAFLGASSRRPSWLTGGTGSIHSRRPSQSTPRRTPLGHRKSDSQRLVALAEGSPTSALPNLQNNVPTTSSQVVAPSSLSSSSSPHTPTAATPAPPGTGHTYQSNMQVGSNTFSPGDNIRKRSETDTARTQAASKRVLLGGPAGNAQRPIQYSSPDSEPAQISVSHNTHSQQASEVTMQHVPLNVRRQARRQDSSPMVGQNGWQQLPTIQRHQAGYAMPTHVSEQQMRILPSNGPPHGPQSPVYNQHLMMMQHSPPLSAAAAGSPTFSTSSHQYPSPVSQAARTVASPQTSQRLQQPGPRQIVQPPPQASYQPPLPILDPYYDRNFRSHLEQFIHRRQAAGLSQLETVESSRFELLSQAARMEDSLYLFVHQIVSQCATGVDALPAIIRRAPRFLEASTLLNNLLAGNLVKDPTLLPFFSQLPFPLSHVAAERPDNYQIFVNYITVLSAVLPDGWDELRRACEQRRYPPVATELWQLNLCSPNLMNLFFQAAVRQVWPTDAEYIPGTHEHAKQLFEENKQGLYANVQGYTLRQDASERLANEYHGKFSRLALQVEQYKIRRQQAAVALPTSPSVRTVPTNQRSSTNHYGQATHPHLWSVQGPHQPRSQIPTATQTPIPQDSVGPVPGFVSDQQSVLLIPAQGSRRPDQVAAATWQLSAVHQAHLRDPRFTDDLIQAPESELLYQYVHTFAISPKRVKPSQLYQAQAFVVPSTERIAPTMNPGDGQRKLRKLDQNSRQFRMRMVKVGKPTVDNQEDLSCDWVLKATTWPSDFYFQLNEQMLEARKKQHHTKDLPIDITELVKLEGSENLFEFYINTDPSDTTITQYAYAIEVIGAKSHQAIIEECESRTIPSKTSLKAITDNLNKAASADDDDDIIIDNATTNITIYDPISQGQICTVPARGRGCKHRECFDLLTFLRSRPRERPHWPSEPDSWKCPICLADVRPQNIVVDGFLKEVRDVLIGAGMEETRAITVTSDGSWVPKIEEGVSSERSTPEATGPAPPVAPVDADHAPTEAYGVLEARSSSLGRSTGTAPAPSRKSIQVVDLSDD